MVVPFAPPTVWYLWICPIVAGNFFQRGRARVLVLGLALIVKITV